MSEYWKSTPSYWCKFCASYVRDTGIERKNHEASAKHQGNIQRSLRELHKSKEREGWQQQRAGDEVARLNGLVANGRSGGSGSENGIIGAKTISSAAQPAVNTAAQRKAHAEQLAALGVQLPEQLKKEVTGVGNWQTVSTKVIEDNQPAQRSLADIVKQESAESENKDGVAVLNRGVHKRKAEDEEEEEQERQRRKAWGSRVKTYKGTEEGDDDLEALLSGVKKKRQADVKDEDDSEVKKEESVESGEATQKPLDAIPDIDAPPVKQENGEGEVVPTVVFKKRKKK